VILCKEFTLKPWDIDRLTIIEFGAFSAVIDDMLKQAREREKQQQREERGLSRKR
jgi:hypothetical protein